MNTEDKIYKKIKNASEYGEKTFLKKDKLWERIEGKLDHTVVTKKKNNYKYLAIAASTVIVLGITLFLINQNKKLVIDNQQNIVDKDSIIEIIKEQQNILVNKDTVKKIKTNNNQVITNNNIINPNQNQIALNPFLPSLNNTDAYKYPLENNDDQLQKVAVGKSVFETEIVAKTDTTNLNMPNGFLNKYFVGKENMANQMFRGMFNSASNSAIQTNSFNNTQDRVILRGKPFEMENNLKSEIIEKTPNQKKNKKDKNNAPTTTQNKDLLVVDGQLNSNGLDELKAEDIEEIIVLPNPLYIINGTDHTEESLFGKNPTSIYYPLSKQEITDIKIYQINEAKTIFGEKGKNGVVVITTKKGMPKKK
jgi:hypothetical protein